MDQPKMACQWLDEWMEVDGDYDTGSFGLGLVDSGWMKLKPRKQS